MDFTPIADPFFYAVAVPGVILTGISKAGLGGAVGGLAVPLMALAIDAPSAVAIMLPILCAMDALGLMAFRRHFDAKVLRIAIPAGLAGIALGWLLFRVVDPRWVKLLIGVESVLFALHRFSEGRRLWEGPPGPLSAARGRFWSAMSGFTSFISHAGGPPMLQFVMPLRLAPMVMVGTLAWFFAVINASKWVPYSALGLFDPANLGTSLALLPAVPVGYWLGLRILRSMSPAVFARIATWALLLTGIKLVWDALA